jgi:hypothetical protein
MWVSRFMFFFANRNDDPELAFRIVHINKQQFKAPRIGGWGPQRLNRLKTALILIA